MSRPAFFDRFRTWYRGAGPGGRPHKKPRSARFFSGFAPWHRREYRGVATRLRLVAICPRSLAMVEQRRPSPVRGVLRKRCSCSVIMFGSPWRFARRYTRRNAVFSLGVPPPVSRLPPGGGGPRGSSRGFQVAGEEKEVKALWHRDYDR